MATILSGIKISSHHHSHHHPDQKQPASSPDRTASPVDRTSQNPSPLSPLSGPKSSAANGGGRLTRSPFPAENLVEEAGNQISSPTTPRPAPTASQSSRKLSSSGKLSRGNIGPALKDLEADRGAEEADTDGQENAPVDGSEAGLDSGLGTPAHAAPQPTVQSPAANSTIDPLSQQIFMRTNTDHSIPNRFRHPVRPDSPGLHHHHMADILPRPSSDLSTKLTPTGDAGKEKKKGPSFLSRLTRSSKKRDEDGDTDSEFGSEYRTDGVNALVFSQAIAGPNAGGGYIPHHKAPPRYIRTKAHNKKTREFNRMFLAQELVGTQPLEQKGAGGSSREKAPVVAVSVAGAGSRKQVKTGGAIWATEFSKDGKYLAAGGRDNVVRVWAVISTPEERRAHEEEEEANGGTAGTGERLSAPVFRSQPIQEFRGHTGEVLDLSWSKNNFLLSSSMDKTVRLWHLSRAECLCTFKHKDFVTKLAFHPRDDRFFLAGSLDTMLRLWSIPDKAIAYSVQCKDLVTAVAFSPDGKTAIAGLLNGLCLFYETEGLKYQTEIHVRSSRGKNAKGSKITGIQTMSVLSVPTTPKSPTTPASLLSPTRTTTDLASMGDVKVLITSNDSRIRIYKLKDKSLDVKFKGHDNAFSQISATFSDDGKYVICGSEDRKAFVWNLQGAEAFGEKGDKAPCEYFEAHSDMVTTTLFAPTRTRILLSASGDPIYDLCNPPPVTLRSLGETTSAAASQTGQSSSEADAPPGSSVAEVLARNQQKKAAGDPSPAYIARSTHYDGNIIVTTDYAGVIKVFRQDCAFVKRKHESWETASTFSRKQKSSLGVGAGSYIGGRLGRSGSIMTKHSNGSAATHSRRGSLSQVQPLGVPNGGNSDMILSWRQGIENGGDKRPSSMISATGTGISHGLAPATPARSERSVSPTKLERTPVRNVDNGSPEKTSKPVPEQPQEQEQPSKSKDAQDAPRHPPRRSRDLLRRDITASKTTTKSGKAEADEPNVPPTPSFTFRSADDDDDQPLDPAGASYSFWNLSRWRGIWGGSTSPGHQRSGSEAAVTPPAGAKDDATGSGSGEDPKRSKSLGAAFFKSSEDSDSDAEKANRRRKLLPSTLRKSFDFGPGENNESKSTTPRPPVPPVPMIREPSGEEEENEERRREWSPYGTQAGSNWSRGNSFASQLSSALSSEIEEAEEREAAASRSEARCAKCGGSEFKAKKVAGRLRVACGRCGTALEE